MSEGRLASRLIVLFLYTTFVVGAVASFNYIRDTIIVDLEQLYSIDEQSIVNQIIKNK